MAGFGFELNVMGRQQTYNFNYGGWFINGFTLKYETKDAVCMIFLMFSDVIPRINR